MRQSHQQQNNQQSEAEALSLFSPEMAAAIRQATCNALAKDLNISTQALQDMLDDKPSKSLTSLAFLNKRLHQFA